MGTASFAYCFCVAVIALMYIYPSFSHGLTFLRLVLLCAPRVACNQEFTPFLCVEYAMPLCTILRRFRRCTYIFFCRLVASISHTIPVNLYISFTTLHVSMLPPFISSHDPSSHLQHPNEHSATTHPYHHRINHPHSRHPHHTRSHSIPPFPHPSHTLPKYIPFLFPPLCNIPFHYVSPLSTTPSHTRLSATPTPLMLHSHLPLLPLLCHFFLQMSLSHLCHTSSTHSSLMFFSSPLRYTYPRETADHCLVNFDIRVCKVYVCVFVDKMSGLCVYGSISGCVQYRGCLLHMGGMFQRYASAP